MSERKSYPKMHYELGCIECGEPLKPHGYKMADAHFVICRGCYRKLKQQANQSKKID
jgi:ribosomal protein S14